MPSGLQGYDSDETHCWFGNWSVLKCFCYCFLILCWDFAPCILGWGYGGVNSYSISAMHVFLHGKMIGGMLSWWLLYLGVRWSCEGGTLCGEWSCDDGFWQWWSCNVCVIMAGFSVCCWVWQVYPFDLVCWMKHVLLELVIVSKAVNGVSWGTWNFTMPKLSEQHMIVIPWNMYCPWIHKILPAGPLAGSCDEYQLWRI